MTRIRYRHINKIDDECYSIGSDGRKGCSSVDSPTVFHILKLRDDYYDLHGLIGRLLLQSGDSDSFIFTDKQRIKFDRLFSESSSYELYGPHGFRSGLGLILILFNFSEADLTRYFYWKSVESLRRYTYGIELTSWRSKLEVHCRNHGLNPCPTTIQAGISMLLDNIDVFTSFFDDFRRILRIDDGMKKRPNSVSNNNLPTVSSTRNDAVRDSAPEPIRLRKFSLKTCKNVKIDFRNK